MGVACDSVMAGSELWHCGWTVSQLGVSYDTVAGRNDLSDDLKSLKETVDDDDDMKILKQDVDDDDDMKILKQDVDDDDDMKILKQDVDDLHAACGHW